MSKLAASDLFRRIMPSLMWSVDGGSTGSWCQSATTTLGSKRLVDRALRPGSCSSRRTELLHNQILALHPGGRLLGSARHAWSLKSWHLRGSASATSEGCAKGCWHTVGKGRHMPRCASQSNYSLGAALRKPYIKKIHKGKPASRAKKKKSIPSQGEQ